MTVAFVIAVFNGAGLIDRTLDSLANQTLPANQVIVMDGGSTDGTVDILARRTDVVTLWCSEPDMGIYDAWNKALAYVTADWVAFLGADDYLWGADVLIQMSKCLAEAPADAPFVYGRLMEVNEAGGVLVQHGRPWAECRAGFHFSMNLPHQGMFHRRAACFSRGGFDARYRIAGDYALLRPLLLKHDPVFVDLVITGAQEGGISSRADKRVLSVLEVGRAISQAGKRRPWRWYLMLLKNHARCALWRLIGDAALARVRRAMGLQSGASIR